MLYRNRAHDRVTDLRLVLHERLSSRIEYAPTREVLSMFAMLLALGIGYTLHAKDVFKPPKPPALSKWSEEVAKREPLEISETDGSKLRGWLYRSDKSDAPFVLFFMVATRILLTKRTGLFG